MTQIAEKHEFQRLIDDLYVEYQHLTDGRVAAAGRQLTMDEAVYQSERAPESSHRASAAELRRRP